jgi:peroxiredoxin
MKQFVQLQENIQGFNESGIAVVGLTYDSPELQQAFIDKHGISFPFLSDIDATSVKALNILNNEHQPGDGAYGIPHPGVYVMDADMTIVGKIFVEAYSTRVDAAGVLNYARESLGIR